MAVQALDPSDSRALKRFVRLERELVGDQPLHWSEADADVRRRLSGRSALTQDADIQPFVVDGAARCAAVITPRWQAERMPGAGGIGWFAAAPGAGGEVREMFQRAEEWLAERGVERVIAPFNGNALLGLGLLTDAYDEEPLIPMPWSPRYYADYLRDAGYEPALPLYVYEVDFSSDAYRAARDAALAAPECSVRPVDKKRWKDELEIFRVLVNEAFSGEWEFQTFTSDEFMEVYGPAKPVLDPRLLLFAEIDGKPVGYCSGFPDWIPLLRAARGRSGPLQLIRFMRRGKAVERSGILSIGLLPEARGRRVGKTLAATFYKGLEEMGLEGAAYYIVNESNTASRALAKSFGARERLLYHCFAKSLA
jgi:GNAT superfamily N-acetyltransferase